MKESLFIRLLIEHDKETILNKAISDIHSISCSNSSIYLVKPDSFNQVPGSPFAYWVSNKVREFFTTLPPLESDGRFVKVGVSTGDDFRFVRLWWEVSSGELLTGTTETLPKEFRQNILLGQRWVPFAKGGEYSPYYADTHLVIDWFDEGRPIESFFAGARIKKPFFFKYGLTFPYKSQKGFSVWQLPSGSICSHTGQLILVNDKNDIFIILALVNSTAFRGLLNLITAFGRREAGYVGSIPVPKLSPILGKLAEQCLHYKRSLDVTNENSHVFYLPALLLIHGNNLYLKLNNWLAKKIGITKHLLDIQNKIDDICFEIYNIECQDRQALELTVNHQSSVIAEEGSETDSEEDINRDNQQTDYKNRQLTADLISYLIGCVFGCWNIRFATGERQAPELPDPLAPLPVCSPGMLIGEDGLPLRETPFNYPIQIRWDGILVDDLNHPDDIIHRVRDVLQVIWGDQSEAIEQEACEILGVKNLRDYFRKPSNGGFWTDHIKRYSKSRRKAPIYSLLQSSNKNYSIWIYYHRLDKDILFKALVNYVEPKLRLEESNLQQLRSQQEAVGTSGKAAKQLEKQIDRQESLISELYDFQDKLRRAANLNLEPDLNDGVVLNIAPLWEIVPWSEAKKYWQELIAGKYEWSSIGKQLRAKGIISA